MSVQQYFAELDNNNCVINVHVVTQEFLNANPDRYPGVYAETFVDLEGKTYAGIGYFYDPNTQDFYQLVQPHPPA